MYNIVLFEVNIQIKYFEPCLLTTFTTAVLPACLPLPYDLPRSSQKDVGKREQKRLNKELVSFVNF